MIVKKLQNIFSLIEKKKKSFFILNFFFIINSIFELLGVSIVVWYSTLVFSNNAIFLTKLNFIENWNLNYDLLGYYIIILFFIKFLINILNNYFIMFFCLSAERKIKSNILAKITKLNYLSFIKKNSSFYFNYYINISTQFSNSVLLNLLNLISNIIICIGIIFFLFFLNFKLTLIFSISFFIIYIFSYLISKNKIKKLGTEINNNNKKIFQNLREMLSDFKSSIIYNNFSLFMDKLDRLIYLNNFKILIKRILVILPKHVFEFLIVIFFITIMISAKSGITQNELMVTIVTFGFSSLRLIPCLNAINVSLLELKFASRPVDELYNFLNYTLEKVENKNINQNEFIYIKNFENIVFQNVSFKYNEQELFETINNLNFNINKGEFVGIIGESGSGKTTILNLLSTLFEPTSGKILVNNIHNINKTSFRNLIAYISQDKFIIDDTIQNNITLGSNEKFNEKKFFEAVKKSKVNEFIESLENKYQTMMGETGVFFSGGQIQRIILARSFYNDKQLYIFDEATNAIDNEIQHKIFKDLRDNFNGKTVVVVSHDKTLLKYFNKVIQIKNGKLV